MAPIFLRFSTFLLATIACFGVHAQGSGTSTRERNLQETQAVLMAEASEANALAEKLRQVAATVDNDSWIGTMYNEVDSKKHTCYILGKLLGQEDAVRHLRFSRNPSLRARDSGDAHSLRVNAQSLENFSYTVNRTLRITQEERATEWNLDCIGHMGVRGRPIQLIGATTFYRLRNDGSVLQILGDIRPGFAAELRRAIESNPRVTAVSLGSGGGSVYEALEAGRFIRRRRLDTMLWNNCYSACPLVFAGGKARTIWSPYPSLGFHKVSSNAGVVPLNSQVYRDIVAYLSEMGVDPRFVLENMLKAEPSEMNLIQDGQLLCSSRLATWIQRSAFC